MGGVKTKGFFASKTNWVGIVMFVAALGEVASYLPAGLQKYVLGAAAVAVIVMRTFFTSTKVKVGGRGVMERTFEQYLRDARAEGKIDFSIRASIGADGHVHFYVHPASTDGETRDYRVDGNVLAADPCVTPYTILDSIDRGND